MTPILVPTFLDVFFHPLFCLVSIFSFLLSENRLSPLHFKYCSSLCFVLFIYLFSEVYLQRDRPCLVQSKKQRPNVAI